MIDKIVDRATIMLVDVQRRSKCRAEHGARVRQLSLMVIALPFAACEVWMVIVFFLPERLCCL